MKSIFETVIRKGGFDLNGLTNRIHEYHIRGALTEQERDELIALARGGATASSSMDVPAEIQKLWAVVRDLQQALGHQAGSSAPTGTAEFVQPTGAHDAYYTGDRVTFGGKVFTCIAPYGVACVWAPDVMPGYWQEV